MACRWRKAERERFTSTISGREPNKFRVQAFGTPASESDTVQLAPATQSYVPVQAVPNWEQGSSVGGWSFALQTMPPEIVQQYMPTLANLGQR